jgi:hypothetical protein
MVDLSGKEFDPILLKAFINMIGVYPIGSLVVLDSGEVGVVVQPNSSAAFAKRPKVKLISDPHGAKFDDGIVDLAEPSETPGGFKRAILMSLDPDQYDIHVYDYLLSQAQRRATDRASSAAATAGES